MEVENPVCNSSNRSDIKNLPTKLTVNLYSENFNIRQETSSIAKIGKGLYQINGDNIIESCIIAGKRIIQAKTQYNTYQLFSYTQGNDSISFPYYALDKLSIDNSGIPYQIIRRKSDPRLLEFNASQINVGNETLVIESLSEEMISKLVTLTPAFSFSY